MVVLNEVILTEMASAASKIHENFFWNGIDIIQIRLVSLIYLSFVFHSKLLWFHAKTILRVKTRKDGFYWENFKHWKTELCVFNGLRLWNDLFLCMGNLTFCACFFELHGEFLIIIKGHSGTLLQL